eukprot:4198601-Prymnesium_polylepis.1
MRGLCGPRSARMRERGSACAHLGRRARRRAWRVRAPHRACPPAAPAAGYGSPAPAGPPSRESIWPPTQRVVACRLRAAPPPEARPPPRPHAGATPQHSSCAAAVHARVRDQPRPAGTRAQ